jgi:hypothetical protein
VNLFGKIFGGSAGRAAPAPQLKLEALEDRFLMSATAAITWQKVVGGSYPNFQYQTTHDFFAIDYSTGHVVQYEDGVRTDRGDPPGGNVTALSVGFDYDPHDPPYLYALTSNGSLWCEELGIWFSLGQGGFTQISAARYNGVYAVTLLGQVELIDLSNNTHYLGAPGASRWSLGSALQISAGFDPSRNSFEVFAIGRDHAIYEQETDIFMQNSTGWSLVDNQAYFTQISATLQDEVFALDANGALYQETEIRWRYFDFWYGQHLAAYQYGGTHAVYWTLSTGTDVNGNDEVYVIDQFSNAFRYSGGTAIFVDSNVKEIAATEGGWFFDVNYDPNNWGGDPWMFDPNSGWIWLAGEVA